MTGTRRAIVTEDSDTLEALLGEPIFIRTVTNYWTGRLDALDDSFLVLSTAAWIADTGRFSEAFATGLLSEIEPMPDNVYVARGAIVDLTTWAHELPSETK